MSLILNTKTNYVNIDYTKKNDLYLLLKLTGQKLPKQTSRSPINLIVAVDISGSMCGEKIEYAKKTLTKLIDNLQQNDRLAIFTFNDQCRKLLSSEYMTNSNKLIFKEKINSLFACGFTNISETIVKTADELGKHSNDFNINRVIVLTDGCPTTGEGRFDKLVDIIKENVKYKATYSFFGFGSDVDRELLTSLSNNGKGNYFYIENESNILQTFAIELGGLISIVAKNIEIDLRLKNNNKYLDTLNDIKIIDNSFKIDDLYAEEEKIIIIKVSISQGTKALLARKFTIADINVKWFNILSDKENVAKEKVKIQYVKPENKDTEEDKEVLEQVLLLEGAKVQEEVVRDADVNKFDDAKSKIEKYINQIENFNSEKFKNLKDQLNLYKDNLNQFSYTKDISYSLSNASRAYYGNRTIVCDTNGRVGIGTNNPTTTLQTMLNSFNEE